MKTQRGLTLIELMVVLGTAGLLSAVALPLVGNGFEAAWAGNARSALLASLTTASTQASVTGIRSVLCPTDNGIECLGSSDWSKGWLVFLDSNGSRELEGGESVLRVQPRLSGKVRLVTSAGRTRIVFQGNGGNAGSNATFTLCDGRGPKRARALIMSNAGGLREADPSLLGLTSACQR